MNRVPAVIDTNVIVAGITTKHAESPTGRIVDGMVLGQFPFLLSTDLLGEYRRVLLRQHILKRHGFKESEVDSVLAEIVTNALMREPASSHAAPDPGDNHLWNLLATHPGSTLVTGDKLLLNNPPSFANVVTPRSFVDSAIKRSRSS